MAIIDSIFFQALKYYPGSSALRIFNQKKKIMKESKDIYNKSPMEGMETNLFKKGIAIRSFNLSTNLFNGLA